MLSFEEIGSAALLSRAVAGLARGRVVFVLPGSRGAVRLGMERPWHAERLRHRAVLVGEQSEVEFLSLLE